MTNEKKITNKSALQNVIEKCEIPQEVKDEGILGSFNRLNYYRMACYENTYELAKKLKHNDLKDIFFYDIDA